MSTLRLKYARLRIDDSDNRVKVHPNGFLLGIPAYIKRTPGGSLSRKMCDGGPGAFSLFEQAFLRYYSGNQSFKQKPLGGVS